MPLRTLCKGDDLRMTWRPLNGYFWPYRINEDADVEWLNPKNDKWIRLKPVIERKKKGNCTYGYLIVWMKRKDGRFKQVNLKSLMIDAFFGGKKKGVVYGFRNGSFQDCSIYNLYPTTQTKINKRYGGGLRKSVEKIDKNGNVLELYSSVTEAAEANFMSRCAVIRRCRNQAKDPFALTGYSFRYERPRRIDHTIDFVHRGN